MATKTETRYIEAIGRRKTAIARARLTPGARTVVTINNKDVNAYFPTKEFQTTALEPFLKINLPTQFAVTVIVHGGGVAGQAALDLSTVGKSLKDAQKMFGQAAKIFLEEIIEAGTANEVLSDLGWKKIQKQWSPPQVVSSDSIGVRIPVFA